MPETSKVQAPQQVSAGTPRAAAEADPKVDWQSFAPSAIALQQRPPLLMARMVSLTLIAIAILAILYAYFSHMDVVVSSTGRVTTSERSKVVQPLEAGVVRKIRVRDGQAVKAGDVLVELDPTSSDADAERLDRELQEAKADVSRLEALLDGRDEFEVDASLPQEVVANQEAMLANKQLELDAKVSSMDAEIAKRQADRDAVATNLRQLQASLTLIKKRHEMREELAKTGHIAELGLIDTRLELANQEKEVAVQEQRLAEASAAIRSAVQQKALALAEFNSKATAELVEATKNRDNIVKELTKAQQRSKLQALRAPINGVVQQLAVFTEGGVVTQAQVLMVIVPDNESIEVEAKVANKDIGHIRVGQRVINKVETYDFTRYGYIEGEVQWVGRDAMVDEQLGPVYPVRIKLSQTETPNIVGGQRGTVTAGMSVTSDIRIGDRRMLEYFLAPLLRYKEESLRER